MNLGNIYRELSKLVSLGLIYATQRPSDADARRNPYGITEAGCLAFDEWLASHYTQDKELSAWLAFIDRVPPADLPNVLDRLRERLWLRTKVLAQERDDALARARSNGHKAHFERAAVRSLLEVKQVTATVEFVEEIRRALSTPTASTAKDPLPRPRS